MDTEPMHPDPANPVDAPPRVIEEKLDPAGPTGQFQTRPGSTIRCLTCGRSFPASSQHAGQAERLEGASDPADMLLVVPLRCPHCAATGTLSLGYGPQASEEDADVLRAIDLPTDRSTSASEGP
jgi:hypothetical protein